MGGVSRQFRRCKREIGELTFIFDKKDTIIILKNGQAWLLIQRWWAVRGTGRSWNNMCRSLKTRKELDKYQIYSFVRHYGFTLQTTKRVPTDLDLIEYYKGGEHEQD